MVSEIFDVVKWYAVIQIFGVIGFILGFRLFKNFDLRGFCISKTLGIFSFSIFAWFLFNEFIGITPYSTFSLYILLGLTGLLTYTVYKKSEQEIILFLKDKLKHLIYIETAFLILFIIFVLLRTYTPNIEGTEKPLEFVVINSLLRMEYLPAIDVWLAGKPLNYYYLGQFIFANIIKLSFTEPQTGFNLINPTVFAMVIIGSYGFIYQLTKSVYWSILAALITGFAGNLEPVAQIIMNGYDPATFRWWDAGHVIPASFPEFPYWSFLHSDVHAHFLVHPFMLMFLFIMLAFIYTNQYLITLEDFKNPGKLALNTFYCLVTGSFMLINSWNYPSVLALTIAGLYIQHNLKSPERPFLLKLIDIIPSVIFYFAFSYSLYLAFYITYQSPVSGIWFVDFLSRTSATQFLILIGLFLLPVIVYSIVNFVKALFINNNLSWKVQIQLLTGIIAIIAGLFFLSKSITITIASLLTMYFIISLVKKSNNPTNSIISAIFVLIFGLILACEFIYVNDSFSGEYERQNTVAKSYIQILLLLPIVTTYIMYLINSQNFLKGLLKRIYTVTITLLLILCSVFLFIGTYSKNNNFNYSYAEQNWHIPTLKGSEYIRTKYDGDYDGIKWLKEHATYHDIVLEAEGAPYSYFGRVSAHSGVPSLINWAGSLDVLHGNYFYLISNPRLNDINTIFRTVNKKDIYLTLRNNGITYIFIGSLERVTFREEELKGFEQEKSMFKKVFELNNTVIYKVL